ncbi:MAG: dTDP-4-dehydrorhamnose 3,5-epimerase, partial [Lentisphaerae bacterium]
MKTIPTELEGVLIIEPRCFRDNRGFFVETWSRRKYEEIGIDVEFVQDNWSHSRRNVVRGLHYQLLPGQAKLVRVTRGRIWDVVVDIRRQSPTFGRWVGVELSAENCRQLFVPVGFAHGFCVLSEDVDVEYKVDSYY